MANLEFCDTHNMVAYLLKIEGSEGFHQIMKFLNTSHIKYAFTKNPTIYASLIQQFWQITAANTLDTGEVQITTTIDGKVKLVSEASIRRHLKLEDSNSISTLPNTKIFEQIALMGLDAGHGSGNIDKTSSMPYDSPLLRVNTLKSDEGSMSLQDLMVLCTTLSQKVESLKADLKQTKQVYGAAYTKLIVKVKKLEKTVKKGKARRKAKIVIFDDEEEFKDPLKQGRSMIEDIDQDTEVTLVTLTQVSTQGEVHSQPKDQLGVLSAAKVLVDATKVHTYTRRRRAVNTGSDGISTASKIVSAAKESVSTAGASMPVSTAGMTDKGKGIMTESETMQTKTERQQEQERLGLEVAMRLQEQFDEEERQRIARVHEVVIAVKTMLNIIS
nr:hypothetical protein [Tanacetum cinerariifolium]